MIDSSEHIPSLLVQSKILSVLKQHLLFWFLLLLSKYDYERSRRLCRIRERCTARPGSSMTRLVVVVVVNACFPHSRRSDTLPPARLRLIGRLREDEEWSRQRKRGQLDYAHAHKAVQQLTFSVDMSAADCPSKVELASLQEQRR